MYLKVRLSDDLTRALAEAASAAGKTPEQWASEVLCFSLRHRDERLRRHFGAVNLGAPTGADNASIDADLARSYSSMNQ
jgi:hypothetical protein